MKYKTTGIFSPPPQAAFIIGYTDRANTRRSASAILADWFQFVSANAPGFLAFWKNLKRTIPTTKNHICMEKPEKLTLRFHSIKIHAPTTRRQAIPTVVPRIALNSPFQQFYSFFDCSHVRTGLLRLRALGAISNCRSDSHPRSFCKDLCSYLRRQLQPLMLVEDFPYEGLHLVR